jgi:myo-inositol-1(or 4)-monophosphatase
MHPMLTIATQAARNAAKIILRNVDRLDRVRVSAKGHNDFVTDIDHAVEAEIINTIHKAYPDHAILAEESGHTYGSDYCWVIDPIDGTTNFIHGFPQFAISIAMLYKNHLEIGLVYDPMRNELFTAASGKGAHLNNTRMRVSGIKQLSEALIGTGFPIRDTSGLKAYLNTFEKVLLQSSGVRRAGSAALDLAYVAAGRLDAFWEGGLAKWDIAAGALLIKEAGGMIADYNGKPDFLENGTVVAATPKLFQPMLDIIQA